MNKKVIVGVIALFLGISLSASSTNDKKIIDQASNIEFVKNAGFVLKDVKDLGQLYVFNATHPRSPKLTLFISKDLSTVVIGNGFSEKGEAIEFPVDVVKYKKDIAYTIGNGNEEYYLFTDPECPYCQKFEEMSVNLKDGIKIHVFLFPLDFHKNAISMSKYILSQKTNADKGKAMRDIANHNENYKNAKYTDDENKKYDEIIKKHFQIAQELGVGGTPSVFDAKGKPVQWPSLIKQPLAPKN